MDRQELYKYIETLNVGNFKEVEISYCYTAKHFEAEQVIVEQRNVRKIL